VRTFSRFGLVVLFLAAAFLLLPWSAVPDVEIALAPLSNDQPGLAQSQPQQLYGGAVVRAPDPLDRLQSSRMPPRPKRSPLVAQQYALPPVTGRELIEAMLGQEGPQTQVPEMPENLEIPVRTRAWL
jgi:hypothetical protein